MKIRNIRYLEPITAATAALAIGSEVASGLGNQAMGMIGQKTQLKGQKKALEQQNAANYDYWLKTNYSAQKEQLKKAGLNPGLMYGMGGGAGGQSGGGSAMPAAQQGTMDIAGAAQLALLQAQKENIDADTENKRAMATATAGVNTDKARTEIESIKQGINNAKASQALTEVQTEIAKIDAIYQGDTLENRIGAIQEITSKLGQEVRIVSAQADIASSTKETIIKSIGVDYLQKLLTLESTRQGISESKARINLMSEQGRAVLAGIVQGYMKIENDAKGIGNVEQSRELERQKIDLQKLTGLPMDIIQSVVGGGILKELLPKRN